MRTRAAVVVLVAVVGGCAPLRHEPAPAVPPTPPPPAPSARAPVGGIHCLQHPRIDVWEHRLRSHPGLRRDTQKSLARGATYLPRLREILRENGVPSSLALLPVVESGFRPSARGRFGELGLWQLRRPTARRFGLQVTGRHDERLDPERATEAAARYLRLLRARYGEWPLALAAYNAGERRVDRAIARHRGASFWQLAEQGWLPRTSRDFVPRFIAVVRLTDTAGC